MDIPRIQNSVVAIIVRPLLVAVTELGLVDLLSVSQAPQNLRDRNWVVVLLLLS
jgi:hypothetical protein